MNRRNNHLIRAASVLAEHYQRLYCEEQRTYCLDSRDFVDSLEALGQHQRLLDKAVTHHFHFAADQLRSRVRLQLERLEYWLGTRTPTGLHRHIRPAPTTGELIRELFSLTEEFDDVQYKRREHRLSVTTDHITLEGIDLGRFRVDLLLDQMRGSNRHSWYRITALDPNYPAANDDIVHPHVDIDRLCPGDASVPIESALRDGRLCDFFMVVRSVLETYNADSAYLRLDEWDGRRCGDCEYVFDSDSLSICEACNRDTCEECLCLCKECSMCFCGGCITISDHSNKTFCHGCTSRCADCSSTCGRSELTDGFCQECFHANHNDDQPDEETPYAPNTPTAAARSHAAESKSSQTPQAIPATT